ncbi:hypothetical protein GGTG_08867 [Gaeumannomyces tritici R3-111a-1]|uniref:CHRD domain-containing protein n=1 Tax=Gaeumannomyces tritici (strain R3-111a-1) TaxID=644352 RepID=J3P5S7_GAET3|nr:hypothetical protein GGTG_08867 [Gaeumannomyces tritici R3-111a-1]EJT75029.1 hypothetical protein GGTG_08867 [Gaeumannomyces tritici R3-111a-1]
MRSFAILSVLSGLAAAGPIARRQAVTGTPVPFGPFTFTSTFNMMATPEQVIGANGPAPGETGAMGMYNYGINSQLDIICYNITLMGVTGPYESPATTATHIHEAALGQAGPPRISFPNPEPANSGPEVVKRSSGCLQGPFTTGIQANGRDTGTGFTLAQIEANPAGFFTDSHTAAFVPGVVRAQLGANAAAAPPAAAPPVVSAPVAGGGAAAPAAPAGPAVQSGEVADVSGCSVLGFEVGRTPLKVLCVIPPAA